jgi:hypothetical protein
VLPSSYRRIRFLDTIGKLLEKLLLARVLREVSERGLLRDEHFGFRPRHSTTQQLARLAQSVNVDKRQLTGADFLDVVKAFDTIWDIGTLYKLTIRNFPSYLVKTTSTYLDYRTFQKSFHSATSRCRGMRANVVQGGIVSPVLFSLYVNDIPTPSRHNELAQYASLLVGYLKACVCRMERWLRDCNIVINFSNLTTILFVKCLWHFGTLITYKFTRIWGFHSSPIT